MVKISSPKSVAYGEQIFPYDGDIFSHNALYLNDDEGVDVGARCAARIGARVAQSR